MDPILIINSFHARTVCSLEPAWRALYKALSIGSLVQTGAAKWRERAQKKLPFFAGFCEQTLEATFDWDLRWPESEASGPSVGPSARATK